MGRRGNGIRVKAHYFASRVAAKIARRAGEGRRAYRQYDRALRQARRRFSLQPERTRAFWPLALLLVAHDRIDHIAPRAWPAAKIPGVAVAQIMSFDPGHALLRFPHHAALSRCAAC